MQPPEEVKPRTGLKAPHFPQEVTRSCPIPTYTCTSWLIAGLLHCGHHWWLQGPSKGPQQPHSPVRFPACTRHLHCTQKVRFKPLNAISPSIVKFFFFLKLKYSHIISSLLFPPSDSSHALVPLRFIFLCICNCHVSTSTNTQIQPAQSILGSSYVYDSRADQVILDNQSRGSPLRKGTFSTPSTLPGCL